MRVNEIFYSIQGEGAHSGEAAIFVRLSGCNLKCSFCDTEHQPYQDLTEDEICAEIAKYPASLVVITGGEPTLQLTETLIGKIHELSKTVAIETNGTRPVPRGVDWVTVSPKSLFVGEIGKPVIKTAQEVKIVLDDLHTYDDPTFGITAAHYFVQPCDTSDEARNRDIINRCVNFVKENPLWRLSLQTQKILRVR
ncbi:MAG: radical SAM protein [Bacteroidaceae bacterium]|jgi:organic radical activating enzyme|nr:radical SAM protein [Bacteroidaceae bacterium]